LGRAVNDRGSPWMKAALGANSPRAYRRRLTGGRNLVHYLLYDKRAVASIAEKVKVPFNRKVLNRERVKLSPESAAKGAGVTVDHIEKWEKGDTPPR